MQHATMEMIRDVLRVCPDTALHERGVFLPPRLRPIELVEITPAVEATLPPGEVLLSHEWLGDAELAGHYSPDTRLAAALPGRQARAKRLDIEPRIVVFENLPAPERVLGQVRTTSDRSWVMDSRGAPAALVFSMDAHRVVIWGEAGKIWLYELR